MELALGVEEAAEASEPQISNACLVELMKKKLKNIVFCWLVVVARTVMLSMVVALIWEQYSLHRSPWHHLSFQARPKGTAEMHSQKCQAPCHRHLRQSEVDLACDLQGRARTFPIEWLSRLAATNGRPGVPLGLRPRIQAEDASCLGAGRPLVPSG